MRSKILYLSVASTAFWAASFYPASGANEHPPRAVRVAPPNIVLILSDDHSYPFLGCLGRPELKTPNLDRFAAEGMTFHRAFTTAAQCVPSRASILTGRSAVTCRITRFSSPLPRDQITFPEILKREAGYFVGVCGRLYHLDGSGRAYEPAVTRDVLDEYHLRTFPERFDYVSTGRQSEIPERINEFFDRRRADQPYFLWVNFLDPHHPWTTGENPPDPNLLDVPGFLPDLPGVRSDLSRHEGEIEHCDGDFRRVIEVIEKRAGLQNMVVIFMGDNGMAFPSGKGSLHDPGLHVPLLIQWPGVVLPGADENALISGEDIAPTCLEIAGLAVPEQMSGVSFLSVLRGRPFETERQYIFAERGPHGSATFDENSTAADVDYSRCIRSARYKLIYNVTPNLAYWPVDCADDPGWKDVVRAHVERKLASEFETLWFTSPRPVYELYDLQEDPNELHSLYGREDYHAIAEALKAKLQEKMILDFDYLPLPMDRAK